MRKIKIVIAIMLLMLMASPTTAYAAEGETVVVIPGSITERIMTEAELEVMSSEMLQMEMIEGNQINVTNSSYVAHEYSQTFDFYLDGTWIAAAHASCIVYRYADGKVHLASREISIERLTSFGASKTYGSIVNTDGSVCYTTGDEVHIFNYTNTWKYAIDFAATPTGQSFNCYEIDY